MVWEVKLPYTLRRFGYNIDKSDGLRRAALSRALKIAGKDSVLYSLSTTLYLLKNSDKKRYEKVKKDLQFVIKKFKW